jgi:flagellar hook-associated protein 3
MTATYLSSINGVKERINKLNTQIATNKRVGKASDDPQAAAAIMRMMSGISANQQYQNNIADAQAATSATDTALGNYSSIMQDFNAVVVKSADGTQTPADLNLFADQIDQLLNEAVGTANTKFNGKYLFGGANTQTAPYSVVSNPASPPSQIAVYSGDDSPTQYQIGDGLKQTVSMTGADVFKGTDMLNAMISIRDKLRGVANPAMQLNGTLSPTAAVGATVDMPASVTDGLGATHDLVMRWTKTADNSWDMTTVSGTNATFTGGTASATFDPVSGTMATFSQTSPLVLTSTATSAAPVVTLALQNGSLKESGDTSAPSAQQVKELPSAADRTLVSSYADSILGSQGKLGAMQQGLTTTLTYLQSQASRLQDLVSQYQDVDVAGAALKLKTEESTLDAALAVAAKVLPKSLMDYLT